MTFPRVKTGNEKTDQFQGRAQDAVRKLEGRTFPIMLAENLIVPVDPATVTIDLPQPITAWFVVNRRGGGDVYETLRNSRRLTLTANSVEADVDIGGW